MWQHGFSVEALSDAISLNELLQSNEIEEEKEDGVDYRICDIRKKYEATENVFHPFHCSTVVDQFKVPILCLPNEYVANHKYTYAHCPVGLDFSITWDCRVMVKIGTINERIAGKGN